MSNIKHPPITFSVEHNPPAQQLFEGLADHLMRFAISESTYEEATIDYTSPVASDQQELPHENGNDIIAFRVRAVPTVYGNPELSQTRGVRSLSVFELQHSTYQNDLLPTSSSTITWDSYVVAIMDHRPESKEDEPFTVLNGENGTELTDREISDVLIVLELIQKVALMGYFESTGLRNVPYPEPTSQEFGPEHYVIDIDEVTEEIGYVFN